MQRRFPPSFYNPVTFAGLILAAVSFGLILFLMLLEATTGTHKPYVGIVGFVVLPTFLIIGLVLLFLGAWRQHRRLRAGTAKEMVLPVLDFNDPKHRRASTLILVGFVLFLLFTAFGSFKAYEYTDSDQFCGEMCHAVMEPEYTAYQSSPHARVGCVQCHIGSGADWFVRSKLSGAYQVYATLFNLYPRPIPTPIQNLRPAQETCEQCHWPSHFYGEKRRSFKYFLTDERNSAMEIDLLMKVGGNNAETGPTSGIHWHMNINNIIEYIPADSTRQTIPWVRFTSRDGTIQRIYQSTESELTEEMKSANPMRTMDCIDCHNRPSHIYHPPTRTVNLGMSQGWIDSSIPSIKKVSVDLLEAEYTTKQGALDSIKIGLLSYYKENYPDVFASKSTELENAAVELQKIYSRNYFPSMKVSWRRFPQNIGHLFAPGCFRCHDGKHQDEQGNVISKDCNACHTIVSQQFGGEKPKLSLTGLEYTHPEDIGEAWKETNCSDCHSPQ